MRRTRLAAVASAALLGWLAGAVVAAAEEVAPLSPDQALDKLIQGNRRSLFSKMSHPSTTTERRREVAEAQNPYAVILGCADSRVPPEIVFDETLGDLFVIRVAGNVVDDAILASIEYAVEHLKVPLVLVLGHERCGAVQAAVDGGEAPGHIGALIKCIRPAVESTQGLPGDAVDNAVRANVTQVVQQLRGAAPILSEAVHQGKLRIVGARYDLDTGVVEILPDPSAATSASH
jgi:carbonic anhydrase